MKQLKHSRIRTRKLHKKLLKKRQTRLKKTLNTKIHEERERIKYPNQDCALEQLFETPFASFVSRAIPLNEEWDPAVKALEKEDDLPF